MNLRHSARRPAAVAFLALIVCAVIPLAADAATVSETSGKLTYTAGPGEANKLTIAPSTAPLS